MSYTYKNFNIFILKLSFQKVYKLKQKFNKGIIWNFNFNYFKILFTDIYTLYIYK